MPLTTLAPLPPADWDESLHEIRDRLGRPLNIHSLMAHHPALFRAWIPFRYHITSENSLSPRQRELVILRVSALCGSEYEWQHHVERGRQAGLSEAEIQSAALDANESHLSESDQMLMAAVDHLVKDFRLPPELREQMLAHFDKTQVLDVMAITGGYLVLGFMLNTFDVPMESDFAAESDRGDRTKPTA
jgi:alkylhydroperoxidase family enzyme